MEHHKKTSNTWGFTARVGPLPSNDGLLPRKQESDEIRQQILKGLNVSIGGPPGTGKSTLMALAASDESIIQNFPDGVFWITVSPQTSALHRQLQLVHLILSNTASYAQFLEYGTIENSHYARSVLHSLLSSRKCLILFDGVDRFTFLDAIFHMKEIKPSQVVFTYSGFLQSVSHATLMDEQTKGDWQQFLISSSSRATALVAPIKTCQGSDRVEVGPENGESQHIVSPSSASRLTSLCE